MSETSYSKPPQQCFNFEKPYCTMKSRPLRKDFTRISRNHQRWLNARRLRNPIRQCELSDLAFAYLTTRDVNAISFIERSIDTFLTHGHDAAERVFLTSSGNSPSTNEHNPVNGHSQPPPNTTICEPLMNYNNGFTSPVTHQQWPLSAPHNILFGEFNNDEFFFYWSENCIPSYDVRNFRPPSYPTTNRYHDLTFKGFCLDCGASRRFWSVLRLLTNNRSKT